MPHKFNDARRHKFDKKRYRVRNWSAYNESLRQRGDLRIWVSEEVIELWSAPRRATRGGQPAYSDLAITMCLTLGIVYKQPLRQTQGLMRSVAGLMGLEISIPDFSTLSRRGTGLTLPVVPETDGNEPAHLVVDSTGLKMFGEGEWLQNKHKTKAKRKGWRKLHLGLDLATGKIVCADMTTDDVGDPTALPDLLDQIDAPVSRFLADGAYDGEPTREELYRRYADAVEIIIPPPKNAVLSAHAARDPTVRDRHIGDIGKKGRMAWQKSTGYNQRSRVETQMGRWKGVIGNKLKARTFANQVTEIKLGQKVLNQMTELGRPEFEQFA